MKLSEFLKQERQQKNMSPTDVANYIESKGQKCSKQHIWNWENGVNNPNKKNIGILMDLYELEVEDVAKFYFVYTSPTPL